MMNLKPFAFILLSLFINSCGNNKNDEKNLFSIDTSALKQVYQLDERVNLVLKNENKESI